MKNCMHCGRPLEDDSAFCTGCGTPVKVPEQTRVCPSCGKALKADALFCTQCGHSFGEEKKECKCEACGAVLAGRTSVCPYCGHVPGTQYVRYAPIQQTATQPEPDRACRWLALTWRILAYLEWGLGFLGVIVLTVEANNSSYWKTGSNAAYVFFYYLIVVGFSGLLLLSLSVFFRVLGERNRK